MKSEDIHDRYRQTELDWYDIQLQTEYYQIYPVEDQCDVAIQNNLEFSDKIYSRGQEIDRYEAQSKILNELTQDKQEYALLKFQFWLNAIKIREVCGADYVTMIYFYNDVPNPTEFVEQNAESNILFDLKQELGPEVILVPLPADLDIDSIDLLSKQFNIQQIPSVVLNENIVLPGVSSKDVLKDQIANL